MLGLPRLRQLRVQNLSCEIHPDFQNAIRYCYDEYSEEKVDKEPFGPGVRLKTSPTAWMYQTASQMDSSPMVHMGKVGMYGGGGSVQNLHSLKNESALILKELKEALWIGRSTRVVFFDFPATGGVLPSSSYRTVKLIRYVDSRDYFVMA